MTTECSGCGQCCEVIVLPITKEEARTDPNLDPRTRGWVLFELTPIGGREARQRAPWLFDKALIMLDTDGRPTGNRPLYYRCGHYDEDTHLCRAWADRPNVCRDYPLYGGEKAHPRVSLPPRCSFRADLGQPIEEWTPVALLDKAPQPVESRAELVRVGIPRQGTK